MILNFTTFLFFNRRALSSSSVDGVCAMLNHACTVLEQEFREILYARLRLGFPSGFDFTQAYNLVQSSIQQGKLQRSDQETQKAKNAFLVSCKSFLFWFIGFVIKEKKFFVLKNKWIMNFEFKSFIS